jgi:FMN phosphatase YigB (HAD superfamily)
LASGQPEWFGEADLYPDVRAALSRLREDGYWVGVAGNQTRRAGRCLRDLELPCDLVATSEDWGFGKPDPRFFDHVVAAAGMKPEEILYVGDRLDNDVRPAAQVGLCTALVRRGPWATIQQHDPDAARVATIRISSLEELPEAIADLNGRAL